jgi:hypothetical protein
MNKANELLRTKRDLDKEVQPIRVPRTKGLTMALIQYHASTDTHQKQEIINNIQDTIISSWLTSGLRIDNQTMNAEQLSHYLNIPISNIIKRTAKALKPLGTWLKDEKLQDSTRAIFSQAFFGILETQSLTKSQAYLLLEQQGQNYVPFLTSEVNKSLANLIASHKPMADLLNILKPAQTGVPATPADQVNKHTVTPDEAITFIRDNTKSVLEDTNLLEAEYTEIKAQESLPDVNARHQDLSSIGIRKKALKAPKKGTSDNVEIPSQHRKRAHNPNIITSADEDISAEDFRI